jgi:hypothetical protein
MSENQDFQSQLVAFVHDTRFEDLPPELVTRTQRHIVDTLGAGLVGASSEVAKDVSTILLAEGAAPVAALWGRGEKTSARNAALLNGIACHALELDDTGGCDHSGAVVIPALLAVLPFCPQPVSGKAFITASVTTSRVGCLKPAEDIPPTMAQGGILLQPAAYWVPQRRRGVSWDWIRHRSRRRWVSRAALAAGCGRLFTTVHRAKNCTPAERPREAFWPH